MLWNVKGNIESWHVPAAVNGKDEMNGQLVRAAYSKLTDSIVEGTPGPPSVRPNLKKNFRTLNFRSTLSCVLRRASLHEIMAIHSKL